MTSTEEHLEAMLVAFELRDSTPAEKRRADAAVMALIQQQCESVTRQRLAPDDRGSSQSFDGYLPETGDLISIVWSQLRENRLRWGTNPQTKPAGYVKKIARNAYVSEIRRRVTHRKHSSQLISEDGADPIENIGKAETDSNAIPLLWQQFGRDSTTAFLRERVERVLNSTKTRADTARTVRETVPAVIDYLNDDLKPAEVLLRHYTDCTASTARRRFDRGRTYLIQVLDHQLPGDDPADFGKQFAEALHAMLRRRIDSRDSE